MGALDRRARRTRSRPSEIDDRLRARRAGWRSTASELDPVALIEQLEGVGAKFGIGRGIHLGDTIIGIKGRVAFEAPAAEVLLAAHRELEKLDAHARAGAREGDAWPGRTASCPRRPAARSRVPRHRGVPRRRRSSACTGEVRVLLRPGSLFVEGVASPHSLMAVERRQVRRSGRRVDGRPTRSASRRSWRCPGCSTPGRGRASEDALGRRRQDRLGRAGVRPRPRDPRRHRRDPVRGRRAGRGRDPEQQVDLQHARAHQRPHGQGRRRATSSSARSAIARRCSATRATCPRALKPGDILQLLNIGGVLGICDSVNPRQGQAVRLPRARLRAAISRTSASASACPRACRPSRSNLDAPLDTHGVPVVALAGTCMEAGKTAAACAIVSRMRHRGLVVDAFKATGVVAAPRHPRDGGRGRAPRRDLHRLRHRARPRSKNGPGAHAHHAHRARGREARRRSCSSSATACSAPTASRRSCATRTSSARSPAVVLSANDPVGGLGRREAAARASSASSRRGDRARDRQRRSASTSSGSSSNVAAFNAMTHSARRSATYIIGEPRPR